jgi:MerR family transcriptional regulator, light-induced transcriptional regulator
MTLTARAGAIIVSRMNEGAGVHPIGVVAKRTGLSLHVLRAWERRYGVVRPERTEGGQRLYSDADVARLRLLRQVTEAGRGISQVAHLSDGELEALAAADVRASVGRTVSRHGDEAGTYVASCLAAGERLDGESVRGTLMRAVVTLRPDEFLGEVVGPLLYEVGERWHAGALGPAQEHVVSVAVRRVLAWMLDGILAPTGAPLLVATTVAGEQHEFGAMMVSGLALEEGWRVSYLGPSLPASEIARVCTMLSASMVAVSVVTDGEDGADPVAEIAELVRRLPAGVPVIVGGAGAAARAESLEAAGARVIDTLGGAREVLGLNRELLRGGAA